MNFNRSKSALRSSAARALASGAYTHNFFFFFFFFFFFSIIISDANCNRG